ncbi:unnamed protein product [marine sediment metagenome]|uniref:Uncharacterized protein n=1 Tax=marine sediment metagenome TaxID=412755 RepID=X0TLS0_9ZZZZ
MKSDIQSRDEKVTELEKAINDKSGDEALKMARSDLDALKQKHQKALDEFKSKSETHESELHKIQMANAVDHSLMGIKFLSTIPEDARNAMIEIAKNDVVKEASFLDGKAVFLDSNSDPIRDKDYQIVTVEARMKEKLNSIIDKGRVLKGVDIEDPKIVKDKDGKIDVNLVLPDSIKTNADLTEFLMKSNMKRDSDEYLAAYKKYSEGLVKV